RAPYASRGGPGVTPLAALATSRRTSSRANLPRRRPGLAYTATLLVESRIRCMKIGVLALQGNFREHAAMLRRLGADPVEVRKPEQLGGPSGPVIPGGESTTRPTAS